MQKRWEHRPAQHDAYEPIRIIRAVTFRVSCGPLPVILEIIIPLLNSSDRACREECHRIDGRAPRKPKFLAGRQRLRLPHVACIKIRKHAEDALLLLQMHLLFRQIVPSKDSPYGRAGRCNLERNLRHLVLLVCRQRNGVRDPRREPDRRDRDFKLSRRQLRKVKCSLAVGESGLLRFRRLRHQSDQSVRNHVSVRSSDSSGDARTGLGCGGWRRAWQFAGLLCLGAVGLRVRWGRYWDCCRRRNRRYLRSQVGAKRSQARCGQNEEEISQYTDTGYQVLFSFYCGAHHAHINNMVRSDVRHGSSAKFARTAPDTAIKSVTISDTALELRPNLSYIIYMRPSRN